MTEQDSKDDSNEESVSVTRHKIIFIGDANVGKTTIISRIMDNPFNEVYEPSIGVDFMSKNIKFRGQNIKLQKGKSSLMIFDRHANLKYKYGNRHFWARGYYVDTVGRNKEAIKKYIQNQLKEDEMADQMTIKEYYDPFTGE